MSAEVNTGRVPRWLLWTAVLVPAAVLFIQQVPGSSEPIPRDFGQYLVAARIVKAGAAEALYFTDAYTGITTPEFPGTEYQRFVGESGLEHASYFIYPPWVGALYIPFTWIPPRQAFLGMYVLNWLFTALAFVLLARAVGTGGWPAAGATFLLLIHTFPFAHALAAGQASLLVFLLMVLTARAHWRGNHVQAGVWWALLTGLKLFPILFLPYFLVLRRWKTLAAFALAGVGILGFSVLVSDVPAHLRFLEIIREYGGYTTPRATNFSLVAFLLRFTEGGSLDVWSVVPIPAGLAWIQRLVFGALLVLILRLAWGADRRGNPRARMSAFALMTVWVLTASANVWSHQLSALGLPWMVAAVLLATAPGGMRPGVWMWVGTWAGFLGFELVVRAGGSGGGGAIWKLIVAAPFFGSLLLLALMVWLTRREISGGEKTPV